MASNLAARLSEPAQPARRRESDVNPFLQGNFGPWREEGEAEDLVVIGQIPSDLNGTFYRNGPNPAYEPIGRYHWFDGDGMIHAIRLRDGRGSYRNRYVQSRGLLEEREAGNALYPGLLEIKANEMPVFKNTANTNIVFHGGKLLALMEAALPTQLVPCSLATIGEHDFDGRLTGPMTAHPKLDPETGEMLFFGYSPFPPYLVYHVADREGRLVRSEPIDVAWPSMIHDFAVTRDEVVFILCPLVFDFEKIAELGTPFVWQAERGTRLGVMPRSGGNADVRWFETDASYVFHPMNAYRERDEIVLDVARFERLRFMNPNDSKATQAGDDQQDVARMHRWRIDLARGGVKAEQLDDVFTEFPRINERLLGSKHRFGYAAARGEDEAESPMPLFNALRKFDLQRGTIEMRSFGRGNGVGEPLFVPRAGAKDEDDGYVLILAYDRVRDASDFYVLDARNITDEPIARVKVPHRIPYGFHGNWISA